MAIVGIKVIPRHDPKIHFVTVLPSGNDERFWRHAYFVIDAEKNCESILLLHYVGDEKMLQLILHRATLSKA